MPPAGIRFTASGVCETGSKVKFCVPSGTNRTAWRRAAEARRRTLTLLHDEAEAARAKHRETHQAVINVAKLFMVEDFEKKAARLAELEAELIPLWREVWAFLDSFVAAAPGGNTAAHAMPSAKMNSIKEMAVKYARIVPDEAGNMRNRHREAHHARLQSLIKGEN